MTNEAQAIEVEVVEVDGITAPARHESRGESSDPRPQPGQDWRQWQGRVKTLDSRWWPLWVLLGAIAVVLLLTLGVVIGVLFVIYRIVRGIFRAIFG